MVSAPSTPRKILTTLPPGALPCGTMMNVNQFYSENMAEDISRGLMDNASKCMSNGSLPLGYKTGKDQKVVLDEAEAAIVQEIFTRVSCYEPFIDIARDLNRRGIKTKKGAEWGAQQLSHDLPQ